MLTLIAQEVNIYPDDGKHPFARTGEISFYHLRKAGAKGILVGHSEAGESIEEVNKKLKAAWDAGLQNNIVLLGECWEDLGKEWSELDDKERERVVKLIKEKLVTILEGIGREIVAKTIFSYEPGWGVRGSGNTDVPPPQTEQIEIMAAAMRKVIREKYNEEISSEVRIIYGGSMSPERGEEIAPLKNIEGFILGSAGTKTERAKQIAEITLKYRKERTPVLALNWKAYELEEPYEIFIEALKPFAGKMDVYLAPAATDIYFLNSILSDK